MLFTPQLGIKSHTKIFICLAYGTYVPLMKIDCCLILLFVKSICTDLDSLSFIRHFLVQIATLLAADCSFLVDVTVLRMPLSLGSYCHVREELAKVAEIETKLLMQFK
jgi:hypothetical protein